MPEGEMANLHGLDCYVTPPLSTPLTSNSRIVYICDAIGLPLVNHKLLADTYAEGTGIRVYVPPFPTKPCPVWTLNSMDAALKPVAMTDIGGQLGRIYHGMQAASAFVPFLWSNKPAAAFPAILDFVRKIKADMASTDGKLGVAGTCWGGYHSTNLCAQTNTTDPESGRLVDAQFTAHPSALAPSMIVDAVATYAVPYSLAYPNNDMALPRYALDETVGALQELKANDHRVIEYEVRIYEDQLHGFAVRGDLEDEKVQAAVTAATQQAIDWFKRFLDGGVSGRHAPTALQARSRWMTQIVPGAKEDHDPAHCIAND